MTWGQQGQGLGLFKNGEGATESGMRHVGQLKASVGCGDSEWLAWVSYLGKGSAGCSLVSWQAWVSGSPCVCLVCLLGRLEQLLTPGQLVERGRQRRWEGG